MSTEKMVAREDALAVLTRVDELVQKTSHDDPMASYWRGVQAALSWVCFPTMFQTPMVTCPVVPSLQAVELQNGDSGGRSWPWDV